MNIEYLREFSDLTETLNFSETAARMFISQSALSKHISRMELELGASLFDRNRQGVALTLAGRRLKYHAGYILRRYDMFLKDIRVSEEQPAGVLRVGFLDAAARNLLRASIRSFSKSFPGIRVQPISRELGELERDLRNKAVDIAITIKFPNSDWPREYNFAELYSDSIAAVVGNDHPLANSGFLCLKELIEYPFLMPTEQAYPDLGKLISFVARKQGIHLDVAYEFSNISSASMMVESGLFVTAMPLHISKLFDGSRFINLTDSEMLIQIGAKWRADSQAPGIEQFVGVLLDSIGTVLPDG